MHGNINIENLRKVIQESLKFKLYPVAGCSKAYFLDLFFKKKSFCGQIYMENVACNIFLLGMSTLAY